MVAQNGSLIPVNKVSYISDTKFSLSDMKYQLTGICYILAYNLGPSVSCECDTLFLINLSGLPYNVILRANLNGTSEHIGLQPM